MVSVISYSISDAQHQWPFLLGRPLGSEDTKKSLGLMIRKLKMIPNRQNLISRVRTVEEELVTTRVAAEK
ncbi:hypothetical protein YC2023_000718 [Brassica napus]